MTNGLVPIEERGLSTVNLETYHPLDVLYQVNPEIASLAYANKENWLNPEVMPLIAKFRECQTTEKVALLNYIVEKSAIDSNERIQMEAQRTMETIAQIEQEGEIMVETIRTAGIVESTRIRYDAEKEIHSIKAEAAKDMMRMQSQAALDVQRLKYEADVKIIQEHMSGQRYLSDNQLRATIVEAEALRDAIVFSERMRAMSEDRRTDAQLRQAIHQAELDFISRMYEAETMRQGEHTKSLARITETYILAQAEILRTSALGEIREAEIKGENERESYRTIAEIAKTALVHSSSSRTTVKGSSKYGNIEVVVEREDIKKQNPFLV